MGGSAYEYKINSKDREASLNSSSSLCVMVIVWHLCKYIVLTKQSQMRHVMGNIGEVVVPYSRTHLAKRAISPTPPLLLT